MRSNLHESYKPTERTTMPRAYATDLRWRAVWLHVVYNMEVTEISQLLSVSPSSVYGYIVVSLARLSLKERGSGQTAIVELYQ